MSEPSNSTSFCILKKINLRTKKPKTPTFKHTTNPISKLLRTKQQQKVTTKHSNFQNTNTLFAVYTQSKPKKEPAESTQKNRLKIHQVVQPFLHPKKPSLGSHPASQIKNPRCYGTIATSTAKAKRGSPCGAPKGACLVAVWGSMVDRFWSKFRRFFFSNSFWENFEKKIMGI